MFKAKFLLFLALTADEKIIVQKKLGPHEFVRKIFNKLPGKLIVHMTNYKQTKKKHCTHPTPSLFRINLLFFATVNIFWQRFLFIKI